MFRMKEAVRVLEVIDAVGAAGSFLDGGPSLPTQRSCVPCFQALIM